MEFSYSEVTIKLRQYQRQFESCEYWARGVHLFYERTYARSRPLYTKRLPPTPAEEHWLSSGPSLGESTEQWLSGCGTKTEIEALAKKHGGFAEEEHYPEYPNNLHYFLSFADTEKALAFCRTEDFDILCITMAKLP